MARLAPATIVRTPSGALEARNGGGCLVLFGLPFATFGAYGFGTTALKVVRLLPAFELDQLLLLPFTLVFLVVGVALMVGRWGTAVDRGAGAAVSWWSVGPFGRRNETPLSSFTRVCLAEDRSGDSTSHVARLEGSGVKPFTIVNSGDDSEVRRVAERVADELALPLADASHGVEVVREPGRFDEPLVERLRRTGALPSPPSPPPGLRSRVVPDAAGVRIEIAPEGLAAARALRLGCGAVSLAMMGIFAAPFVGWLLDHTWGQAVIAALIAAVLLPPLLGSLPGLGRRTVVTATRGGLCVETRTPLARRLVEIPAEELEELVAPSVAVLLDQAGARDPETAGALRQVTGPGREPPRWLAAVARLARYKGLTAISDRTSVTFGQGLPETELRYLADLIVSTMA
ncbi:MAG: hypothetical protein ACOY3Y_15365 [Acidobacteriota bacterium]